MTTPVWNALARCAGWEWHRFAAGPLEHLLIHAVTDPASLLRGDGDDAVHASARLALRDGLVFGVSACAPRARLLPALECAAALLAGQRYDESTFLALDAALAAALHAAGLENIRITLERNAPLLARPQAMPDQLGALALQAVNAARREQDATALQACPPAWLGQVRQACSFAHPRVLAYEAALDAHALAYRATARQVHGMVLDRLAVHNFLGARAGHARNRAQAMQALPWLLPLMIAHLGAHPWEGAADILQAIDRGLPLYEAVACAFGVAREVVRWLGRRALPAGWIVDPSRLRRLLALLAWLAPERRPHTPAQFEALTALGSALAAPFTYRHMADEAAALARIGPCMRPWLARATRAGLDGVLADAGFAQRSLALADGADFLRALYESMRAGDGLDEEAADVWVLRWCAAGGAPRLLALSQAWHATVAEVQEQGGEGAPARWPAVLATPWQGEKRIVVELTGVEQLRSEGRKMGHCVGSYELACRMGNSVIVALRSASGVSLSTAELHLLEEVPGIPGVVAGQHRAARNAAPGTDCVRALAALVRHLNRADARLLTRRRAFQRRQQEWGGSLHGAGADAGIRFGVAAQQAARRLALIGHAAGG